MLLGAPGPFDGPAHEPRRHGVQLAYVVFPGRSGRPGGVIDSSSGWIGTTVGLTNVELWLQPDCALAWPHAPCRPQD